MVPAHPFIDRPLLSVELQYFRVSRDERILGIVSRGG
jgi:hypothetical protein